MYELEQLQDFSSLSQWYDGPRQFKSGATLATSMHLVPDFGLRRVRYDFGCPCHWKGIWDTYTGRFKAALYAYAMHTRISELTDVQLVFAGIGHQTELQCAIQC